MILSFAAQSRACPSDRNAKEAYSVLPPKERKLSTAPVATSMKPTTALRRKAMYLPLGLTAGTAVDASTLWSRLSVAASSDQDSVHWRIVART